MCTELHDPTTGAHADCPRDLAAIIGEENIVWHDAYQGCPGGEPSVESEFWMNSCLCPVDIEKTMVKIGGEAHGYMGESGYFEITLPASLAPSPR